MDSATQQLEQLTAGAVAHAQFAHGLVLGDGEVETAEKILRAERLSSDSSQHSMVSACYGAWIASWAIQTLHAEWTGVDEPFAPRLRVGGVICSPIDAVMRFLADSNSDLGPVWMAAQMQSWVAAKSSLENVDVQNAAAWDQLTNDPRFSGAMSLPADRADAIAALDPWLREGWQTGCELLCLGGGGGRQGPLHAIAGARVTVVDVSQKQLDHDRVVAQRLGLSLTLVCGSADRLAGLSSGVFDVVVQPVSGCYVADLANMYREVARVLRPGGCYLVQHKQPVSMRLIHRPEGGYQLTEPAIEQHALPAIGIDDSDAPAARERGTLEFAHSLDALIGGLCRAGFVIERFAEPPSADAFAPPGSAAHQACFAPPYFKLKATKVG